MTAAGRVAKAASTALSRERVMVLNCGSSSIKFQVVEVGASKPVLAGQADRLNTSEGRLKWQHSGNKHTVPLPLPCYPEVVERVCEVADAEEWGLVGHRVVHGGTKFPSTTVVDASMLEHLAPLDSLAPLHNPRQRSAMALTLARYPGIPQAAAFDTMWHSKMPQLASLYALPSAWEKEHNVRRYGFHGLSHNYVVDEVIERMGGGPGLKVISCHLGAGCSVAASEGGLSKDTSMGFSPGEGLMMGVRAGDFDPSIVPYMAAQLGVGESEILRRCGEESGFLGLSGTPDSKELEDRYEGGDAVAALTIDMFCYRVAKMVASYLVPLGGLDALVFTGGIGEKSWIKRAKILDLLAPLGLTYSREDNLTNGGDNGALGGEKVKVWVIPTDEEAVIARETRKLFSS